MAFTFYSYKFFALYQVYLIGTTQIIKFKTSPSKGTAFDQHQSCYKPMYQAITKKIYTDKKVAYPLYSMANMQHLYSYLLRNCKIRNRLLAHTLIFATSFICINLIFHMKYHIYYYCGHMIFFISAQSLMPSSIPKRYATAP